MKLYGICYAMDFIYGTYGSVFSNTSHPEQPIENFPFFYYFAEHNGKNILIDTGFHNTQLADSMGVRLLPVRQELNTLFPGGLPEIDAVLLTHSHWDHIGNISLFPDAEIYLCQDSYELAMQEDDTEVKNRLSRSGVHIVKTPFVLYDKFELVHVGGHTPDSCAVLFRENDKNYVITGDECYLCENMEKTLPIGITVSEENNLAFLKKMKEESRIALPFHDNTLFAKYKQLTDHIIEVL